MRVSEGTRTPDRLDHNQELYQLSYAHRGTYESTSDRAVRRSGGQFFGPVERVGAVVVVQRADDVDRAAAQLRGVPVVAGAPQDDQRQPGEHQPDHPVWIDTFVSDDRPCTESRQLPRR